MFSTRRLESGSHNYVIFHMLGPRTKIVSRSDTFTSYGLDGIMCSFYFLVKSPNSSIVKTFTSFFKSIFQIDTYQFLGGYFFGAWANNGNFWNLALVDPSLYLIEVVRSWANISKISGLMRISTYVKVKLFHRSLPRSRSNPRRFWTWAKQMIALPLWKIGSDLET